MPPPHIGGDRLFFSPPRGWGGGRSASKRACNSVDACVDEGACGTALVASALRGEKEAFAMLLEGGAGPLVCTGGPRVTPVHAAAWGGHVGLVKRMMSAGATWTDFDR